jgi:hypothetical protein
MNNNPNKDATSSFAGYEYQFLYYIELIIDNINNNVNNISFNYEGIEDINIYIDDILNKSIQIKYHFKKESNDSSNQILNPNNKSGFYKVFENFVNNYDKMKNIDKIIYSISTNIDVELKTSPKIFKNIIENNDIEELKDIINTKYPKYIEDKDIYLSFINKIEFEYIKDKQINDILNNIYIKIENSYFNDCLNKDIKIAYKTQYLFSLLTNFIISIIFNKENINNKIIKISDIISYIKTNIKKDYNENILIDEIINMISFNNSNNQNDINLLLINKLTDELINSKDLENLYKLLNKSINNKSLYKDLQYKIHNVSINIYTYLLNKNKIKNNKDIKTISNSISKILNNRRNTQKIHEEFKKLIIENKELLNNHRLLLNNPNSL